MPLTHLSIANAKEYKLADSDALYLAVRPSGAKLWRMNYRHLGQQKTLYFGAWPEVGIAAARAKRDVEQMQLASDLDPASEKKRARVAARIAANNSFDPEAARRRHQPSRFGGRIDAAVA